MIERAFDEASHPRGRGALGGQFIQSAAEAKAARRKAAAGKGGGGNLSFDGKRGAGYGSKNGDSRVKQLQQALNRLGLTDASGKALKVDGKLGPRTTAAIKKWQRSQGLKADGVVTPALLKKMTSAKKAAPAKAAKKATKKVPAKRAAPKKKAPTFVKPNTRKAVVA